MKTTTKVIAAAAAGIVLTGVAIGVGAATSSTRTKIVNHTVVRTVVRTVPKPVVHAVTKVVPGPTVTKTVTMPGATVTPVSCLEALPQAESMFTILQAMARDALDGQRTQFVQDQAQYNDNVPGFNANEALCLASR